MPDRPHILLVMTDQQRYDSLRCAGYDHMITPHVDALAARGVAFSHAFVQGAVCGPSRNSIVSAQYVHTHGVYANEQWLTPGQPNWIEALRAGGYHTVNIGKMHTAPIRLSAGFAQRTVVENKNYQQGLHGPDPDDYDLLLLHHGRRRPALTYYQDIADWPERLQATVWPLADDLYPDNVVGRLSLEVLERHDFEARPLFLWSGFVGPHDPYDVTAEVLARYDDVDVPDPVGFPGELQTKPPPQAQAMAGMEGRRSPAALWWSRATPERIRRMRRHYYANVTLIDAWVGRMVAALAARGQLDDTLILYTSDHGDCLGDHHQVYKFSSHYDSVARVPLVVAGPGVAAQRPRDCLVEAIDLGPTCLDLAGLPPLPEVSGRSLAPLLRGGEGGRDCVFSEHGQRVMARTHDHKLVLYLGQPWGELYDLRRDPDELHNLYDDPGAREARRHLVERTMHWYGTTRMKR